MAEKRKWENTRQIGNWGETVACEYLASQGFEILERNVYTEYSEIDIVSRKADQIHMIEVNTRRSFKFGHPEESIIEKKQQHMLESAQAYLQANPSLFVDYQFDLIAILIGKDGSQSELTYFTNAI